MRRLLISVIAIGAASLASADLPTGFSDSVLTTNLSLPTGMAFTPDGRLFILQKSGLVRVFKNGALQSEPVASIPCDASSGRGLLGIAFDSSFATNAYVYLYYTAGPNSIDPPATPKNRVSRFTIAGDTISLASEVVLLDEIPSDSGSDNGGTVRLGIDGNLYVSTGDGGTVHTNSQDLGSLGGKLLRIKPDGTIPANNPFVGQSGARPEVWCYGLRNPFRFTLRPGTTTPFIADNGDRTWEEINIGVPAANFGWPNQEGPGGTPLYTDPVHAYNHDGGSRSVIGGPFGASSRFPIAYAGRYFFAEYKLNQINYLDFSPSNQLLANGTFGPTGNGPVDLALGPDGSLYYVTILDHSLHRISYRPRVAGLAVPSAIDGGASAPGSLALNCESPAGRQSVALSSSTPAALTVPAAVTVSAGLLDASFILSAKPVSVPQVVNVTASLGIAITRPVTVTPNGVAALYVAGSTVPSGRSLKFTVALATPALQPVTVQLSSTSANLSVPATLTLDPGALAKGFFAQALPVTSTTSATVKAKFGNAERSRTIQILRPALDSLVIAPNPIIGGQPGQGTITLVGVSAGGVTVTTYDNTTLIQTPASTTIPLGWEQGTFTFTTSPVTIQATRTITAQLYGVTRTVNVVLTRN